MFFGIVLENNFKMFLEFVLENDLRKYFLVFERLL